MLKSALAQVVVCSPCLPVASQEGFGNPGESGSRSVTALVKMDNKGQLFRRRRGNAGTSLFYFTF